MEKEMSELTEQQTAEQIKEAHQRENLGSVNRKGGVKKAQYAEPGASKIIRPKRPSERRFGM